MPVNTTGTEPTPAQPSFFQQLAAFLTSPLGIVIIIAIILLIIIWLYFKFTKKSKEFEHKTFDKMIEEDMKAKFSLKSVKISAALVQGFIELGKINRVIHEKGFQDILYFDPKQDRFVKPPKSKAKEYPSARPYDLHIFRLNPTGFILVRFIRWLLGIQKFRYVFLDTRFLENYNGPQDRMFNIKQDIAFQVFGKVFITSDMTKDYISDISIKYSHESLLTYVGNFAAKVIYIEAEHTKAMNRYRTKKEIDTKAYKEYKKASDDVKETDDDND